MDEIQVQPLSSSEVLDLLLGVSLNKTQAVVLMGTTHKVRGLRDRRNVKALYTPLPKDPERSRHQQE